MLNILVIICDDESVSRKILRDSVEKVLQGKLVRYEIFEFSSGEELLKNFPQDAGILFLDIRLKKLDGIETAREVRKFNSEIEIIFITALGDYARFGYEVGAFRYLLKSSSFEEFRDNFIPCIDRVLEKENKYIFLKNKEGLIKIRSYDILFVETDERSVIVHTSKKDYRFNTSMKDVEEKLTKSIFYRCHTSFIINLHRIDVTKTESIVIKDTEIHISKHRYKEFKLIMASYFANVV